MALEVTTRSVYVTSDNEEFDSYREAVQHEEAFVQEAVVDAFVEEYCSDKTPKFAHQIKRYVTDYVRFKASREVVNGTEDTIERT